MGPRELWKLYGVRTRGILNCVLRVAVAVGLMVILALLFNSHVKK